ncbi:MAG: O-acetylserine/cysteine efflux transporter [Saprospiraceae bacterium]|jgi:O-acetylserine/cysteine efflux transporter
MSNIDRPFSGREWSALLLVLIGWSVNYLAIRYGVNEFPVWIALSIRFAITAAILTPFFRLSKSQIIPVLWVMLVLAPGHFAFLFYALKLSESVSTISIVVQIAPAFSVLLAWVFLKDIPGVRRVLGLGIAFLGIIVLLYNPNFFDSWPALVTGLLAAFFLGLYPILLKKIGKIHPLAIIAWSSAFALPITLLMSLINGEYVNFDINHVSSNAWMGVVYTAIGSSVISHGTWAWLVQRQSVSKLAPIMLCVPITVVLLSVIFLNETLTLRFLISAAIVLLGIFIITKSKAYR